MVSVDLPLGVQESVQASLRVIVDWELDGRRKNGSSPRPKDVVLGSEPHLSFVEPPADFAATYDALEELKTSVHRFDQLVEIGNQIAEIYNHEDRNQLVRCARLVPVQDCTRSELVRNHIEALV